VPRGQRIAVNHRVLVHGCGAADEGWTSRKPKINDFSVGREQRKISDSLSVVSRNSCFEQRRTFYTSIKINRISVLDPIPANGAFNDVCFQGSRPKTILIKVALDRGALLCSKSIYFNVLEISSEILHVSLPMASMTRRALPQRWHSLCTLLQGA
jgi:hypothetical protein